MQEETVLSQCPKIISLKTSPPPPLLKDKQSQRPVGDLGNHAGIQPHHFTDKKAEYTLLKITQDSIPKQLLPSFLTMEAYPVIPTFSNSYSWQRHLKIFAGAKTGSEAEQVNAYNGLIFTLC